MKFNETQGQTFEQKFLVGPVTVDNILINPTLRELKEWGVDYLQNEPVYTGEQDGVKFVDIVFWCKWADDPNQTTNWVIRLKNQNMVSKTGKTCYINYKGTTSWAESEDDLLDWFKSGEYRKAIPGEEQLYSFMTAFNNINLSKMEAGESILESEASLKALFAGNFADIKFASTLKDFKIQIIKGLVAKDTSDKDGNPVTKFYDRVYTNVFFKHWETTPYLYESKEKKGKVAWDYYINYLINVDQGNFNPDIIKDTPTVMTLAEVRKEYAQVETSEIPIIESKKDDLPFNF